jgi:hypothetical protein
VPVFNVVAAAPFLPVYSHPLSSTIGGGPTDDTLGRPQPVVSMPTVDNPPTYVGALNGVSPNVSIYTFYC